MGAIIVSHVINIVDIEGSRRTIWVSSTEVNTGFFQALSRRFRESQRVFSRGHDVYDARIDRSRGHDDSSTVEERERDFSSSPPLDIKCIYDSSSTCMSW